LQKLPKERNSIILLVLSGTLPRLTLSSLTKYEINLSLHWYDKKSLILKLCRMALAFGLTTKKISRKLLLLRFLILDWINLIFASHYVSIIPARLVQFFNFILGKSWADPENRKWFFVEVARRQEYSPFIAENWYSVDTNSLASMVFS
jgi:hypothetical protein